MGRTTVSLVAVAALLQGCIIYETEDWREECRSGDTNCVDEPRDDDHDDIDDEDPVDDEDPDLEEPGDDDDDEVPVDDPDETFKIWLSVAEGRPGDSLLTWLETDGELDFTDIERVTFVGDVQITDAVYRSDEAFLLVEIPHDAEPGVVQGFVELTDGDATLLSGGFTVLEPAAGGDDGTCDCTC